MRQFASNISNQLTVKHRPGWKGPWKEHPNWE